MLNNIKTTNKVKVFIKMVKRCAWGTCNSDSRYPERLVNEVEGTTVTFHPFPTEIRDKERRKTWIRACCRKDGFVCTKDSYVCSLQFVDKKGPTEEYHSTYSSMRGSDYLLQENKMKAFFTSRNRCRERIV